MAVSLTPLILTGLAVVAVLLLRSRKSSSKFPLPPGPAGYPIIGNLLEKDKIFDWRGGADTRNRYGDITSLSILGTTVITLHTYDQAVALLDKKSLIYSSRPPLTLPGLETHLTMLPYGSDLRECRRMIRKGTEQNVIPEFYAQQQAATGRLLRALDTHPEQFYKRLAWYTGSIILKIVYGYDTEEENDPVISTFHTGVGYLEEVTTPGNPLGTFPWLRHVPSWVPGVNFKKTADQGLKDYIRMRDSPFQHAVDNKDNGDENFATHWYKTVNSGKKLDLLKEAALGFFLAGVGTSETVLNIFFFEMQANPEVQKRAQAELDSVVGRKRLPSFEDREQMPYINALCKELLRHAPPLPNSVPHQSTEDDVHEGYFIPKGSIVIPCVWEMSRDPTWYKDPEEFNPSRFLGPNPEQDPALFVFGFGRRICSGALLADVSLFNSVAAILATFDINAPANKDDAKLEFPMGLINHPLPFKCNITVRADTNLDELLAK